MKILRQLPLFCLLLSSLSFGEGNRPSPVSQSPAPRRNLLSPDHPSSPGYHSPSLETLRRLSRGRMSDILIASSSIAPVHQIIAERAENPGGGFVSLVEQRVAQDQIEQLLGPTIALPPGAFFFNRLDESVPEKIAETLPNLIHIEQPFELQKFVVSVSRYEKLMGNGGRLALLAFSRLKKFDYAQAVRPEEPIQYLTQSEEDHYIHLLNKKIAELWPIAYPDRPIPLVRKPTQEEWLYANTTPVSPVGILFGKDRFQINARMALKSDERPKSDTLLPSDQSPSHVLTENDRGFVGLGQSIKEVTLTVYEDNLSTQVARGGGGSTSRPFAFFRKYPEERSNFGLRLALDFGTEQKTE